jgi:cell division protease FtsH
MIDEEVRILIDAAYQKTKALLREKKKQVEILAKELLVKEVLFQSDVETLIGKRPFDDRKHEESDGEEEGENHQDNGTISAGVPPYDSSITMPAPKPAP